MKTALERPVVLLDLDDTILDFKQAESCALTKTLRHFGLDPDGELIARYSAINASCWEQLEEGRMTREQVLTRRFELLFQERGIDLDGYQVQLLYEHLLGEGHWFMPGAEELLRDLSRDGYRLFIVSNGSAPVQDSRIASAGIAPLFEKIFISERIGADKPGKAFFDACFAQIPALDRSRCLIVGDSLSSDIRGGINAGICTCWYNYRRRPAREDIRPDHEIRDLSELPPLLKALVPH